MSLCSEVDVVLSRRLPFHLLRFVCQPNSRSLITILVVPEMADSVSVSEMTDVSAILRLWEEHFQTPTFDPLQYLTKYVVLNTNISI